MNTPFNRTVLENLQGLLSPVSGRPAAPSHGGEQPLRSELFSASQMVQHGKSLATEHELSDQKTPEQLLARLGDNETVLHQVREQLTDAVKESRWITPAGEWFLDNFYLMEEQIRVA